MRITFVCHGNICRSPMAEFYLKSIAPDLEVNSRATHTDEIGNDLFYAAKEKLKRENVPFTPHKATLLSAADYDKSDYFLVMDTANFTNSMIILNGDPKNKVFRLLEFANLDRDVADPWYTGNFDAAFDDIKLGVNAFLKSIGYEK
ncbi:MAG: low molecular weight protein-tyrosine-phosphatase [Christensenellales bacterium]